LVGIFDIYHVTSVSVNSSSNAGSRAPNSLAAPPAVRRDVSVAPANAGAHSHRFCWPGKVVEQRS
jgi:hypothetical protein